MEELFAKIEALKDVYDSCEFAENSKEGLLLAGMLGCINDIANILDTSVMFADNDDSYYSYSVICQSCGEEIPLTDEELETETQIECPKCGDTIILGVVDRDTLKF